MTLATTCPSCGTTFRVRSEQLRVRGGQVRCGVCKHVFRALDALRTLEAPGTAQGATPGAGGGADAGTAPVAGAPVDAGPAADAHRDRPAIERPLDALPWDEASPPTIVGTAGERLAERLPPRSDAWSRDDAAAGADATADADGTTGAATAAGEADEYELSLPRFDASDDPALADAAQRLLGRDRGPDADDATDDPFARPLAPQARAVHDDFHSSIAFGPAPAAGGDADARTADDAGLADAFPGIGRPAAAGAARQAGSAATVGATAGTAAVDAAAPSDDLFGPTERGRARRAGRGPAVAAIVLLSLGAALQAALMARDTLAARTPGLAPALRALASATGLEVGLPRRLSRLTIEGFDLQAEPGGRRLVLSAVLRNTGDVTLQWPAMEVTLTDTAGQVIVRRALLPAEYLRGTPARPDAGIAPGTELPLKLLLEGPTGAPTGYSVDLFYP